MSEAHASAFVYVTYIRTSAEKLWSALLSAEFTRQYWFGTQVVSDFTVGAPWKLIYPDGRVTDTGEVLEVEAPRRLVLRWQNEFRPELKAEGMTLCTFELEPKGEMVKLTVTHSSPALHSKMIDAVSGGWPLILANLKTLLETGTPLATAKP